MASSNAPVVAPTTIDRHASAIFSPMAMLAGMQLDLFTVLRNGPLTSAEIAGTLGVEPTRLNPLLYALVVAELLTVQDDRFSNTPEAGTYLVAGRASYRSGNKELYAGLWSALLMTSASIRADAPQALHDFYAMSEAEMIAFFRGQHHNATLAGERLASTRDFMRFRHMLDAAGGSGGVAIGACRVCPGLLATVADLPKVIPVTRQFLEEARVADHVSTVAVDLVAEPPTGTYDVAVIRNLVQVLSLEQAGAALRNVAQSLAPGSPLFIVGAVLDDSRLSPPHLVGQNLVHVNIYADGLVYTQGEYRTLVADAGFVDIAVEHGSVSGMPAGNAVVSARKPK
jgi:2-hydroxy-4-(methylsulfanyl)butanoate S-methyltransferase